jgi:hypothetical protein
MGRPARVVTLLRPFYAVTKWLGLRARSKSGCRTGHCTEPAYRSGSIGPVLLFAEEGASATFWRRSTIRYRSASATALAGDHYFGYSLAPGPGTVGTIFGGDIDAGNALLSSPGKTLTLPGKADSTELAWMAQADLRSAPSSPASSCCLCSFAGPNRDQIAGIDRQQGRRVVWDPAGYTDTDVAAISLAQDTSPSQVVCQPPRKGATVCGNKQAAVCVCLE